ncbi:MAG: hypothetical protein JO038_05285 [Alphaproteobacteria bacterium]|nr:hypothetical protein [Alphaproteobacteria bacterium]
MIGRLIGIIVLCFLVGLLLATLGITAEGILYDTWHTVREIIVLIEDFVRWAVPYTLLGAVIVIPLALLGLVQRLGRGRSRRP